MSPLGARIGKVESRAPHIDHVIPRSFVFEDEIWNLVATCGNCNGAKSDILPDERFIAKLADRNFTILLKRDHFSALMSQSLLNLPRYTIEGAADSIERALMRLLSDARDQGFSDKWRPLN